MPSIEIVGVGVMASEKVAVIVITEEFDTIPLGADEESVTVGEVESLVSHC